MAKNKLSALFYPNAPFNSLFIPHILKEIYIDRIYDDALKNKSNLTIIDIGANIGAVTHYLIKYAKKLYAIEPSTEHFEALKKNKEFNEWDNVEIFNMAIADKDGEMTLYRNNKNRTCHSLEENHNQGGEQVKTMQMDTFFKENNIDFVDFMKLDVEGAENMILKSDGFKNVARKIKIIQIEFHSPKWQDLVAQMTRLGFTLSKWEIKWIGLFIHE